MTVYERGSLVLVNFNPQRKSEEVGKVRPAIIVSDTDLNDVLDLVAAVPLTTNLIDNAEPLRVRIAPKDKLDKPSDAMIDQLRCIAKSRIIERIGTVSDQEMGRITAGMEIMLGIGSSA